MLRLKLALGFAVTWGALGVFGVGFAGLGVLVNLLGCSLGESGIEWSKIGNMFAVSFMRAVVGYSSAAVIHAVAILYQRDKANPPR